MRAIVFLLLLTALTVCYCAPIDMETFRPPFQNLPAFDGSTPLDEWCYEIGLRSGCSGCTFGSQHLCSYYVEKTNPLQSACIGTTSIPSFDSVYGTTWINGNHLCPENYLEEPLFKTNIRGSGNTDHDSLSNDLSNIKSHAYNSDYCMFTEEPWIVDRTMYFTLAKDLQTSRQEDFCASVNSKTLSTFGLGSITRCSMDSDYDKQCMEGWASLLCTTRCPHYGKAVLGFCRDTYEEHKRVCGLSDIEGRCVPEASVLEEYIVSEDALIQGCQDMFEIPVSETFKNDWGFYGPCIPSDCEYQVNEPTCDSSHIDGDDCDTVPFTVFTFSVIREACGGKTCEQIIFEDADDNYVVDDQGTPFGVEDVNCPVGNTCTVSLYVDSEDGLCENENDCNVDGLCGCGITEDSFRTWSCLGSTDSMVQEVGLVLVNPASGCDGRCDQEFVDVVRASPKYCFYEIDDFVGTVWVYTIHSQGTNCYNGQYGALFNPSWQTTYLDNGGTLAYIQNHGTDLINSDNTATYSTVPGEAICRGSPNFPV